MRIQTDGRERTLLFDTGVSPNGMVENMRRLGIAPADIEAIVLSHGHWDHVTGMEGLVRELGPHPLAGDDPSGVLAPAPDQLPRARARRAAVDQPHRRWRRWASPIVEERRPSFLLDGAVLITGEVDRTTEFETGFLGHEALRDGDWRADPLILDDQALVVRVRDRGLVVLSGCGHAGIVNTVRYARRLTGHDAVAAIIGGFHLSGPMFERIIGPTVDALVELSPSLLMPAHCTGMEGGLPARRALPGRVRDECGRDHGLDLTTGPGGVRVASTRRRGAPQRATKGVPDGGRRERRECQARICRVFGR